MSYHDDREAVERKLVNRASNSEASTSKTLKNAFELENFHSSRDAKTGRIEGKDRQWQKRFLQLGAKCYYCDRSLTLKTAVREHRIPRCRGGSDSMNNLVPSCASCNMRKAWRTEAEFAEYKRTNKSTTWRKSTDINKTNKRGNPRIHGEALELLDEPSLLEQLVKERDGPGSYAWMRLRKK